MKPIATYTERRFDGTRVFALFEDRIVIHGKATLKSEFDATISLTTLEPNYGRLCMRHNVFFAGLWFALGSWLIAFVVHSIGRDATFEVVWFLGFMGLVGILIMLATARKVEWVRFGTGAGIVLLDIAYNSKEREKLDSFVEVLVRQIHVARTQTEHPNPN